MAGWRDTSTRPLASSASSSAAARRSGRLEAAGALVHTYDGPSFFEALRAGEVTHPPGLLAGLLRTADVVLPRVLERVGGQHFDYVVHDSMLGCGRLAAQVLGLAAVCSCSTFARSKAVVDTMLDDVAGRTPATTQRRLEEDFARMVGVVEERYGVSIASPYEVYCNPAPLTIVYTSRRFQPDAERIDESYKFVGPSVATRHKMASSISPAGTRPTWYIRIVRHADEPGGRLLQAVL